MGKVKREREKQMTKEKMTKPRDSLQDTELLSMVGLLMDLVAVLKIILNKTEFCCAFSVEDPAAHV